MERLACSECGEKTADILANTLDSPDGSLADGVQAIAMYLHDGLEAFDERGNSKGNITEAVADIGAALRATFISPNEADRNWEPANVVDAGFAIARAIDRLADMVGRISERGPAPPSPPSSPTPRHDSRSRSDAAARKLERKLVK